MITEVFPTAIGVYDLSFIDDYSELYEYAKNTELGYHALTIKGSSSFNTQYSILNEDRLQTIKSVIYQKIREYCSQTGLPKLDIAKSWINVNEPGSYTLKHNHPMSVISGALYIKAENTSPIIFESPLNLYKMHEPRTEIHNKYTEVGYEISAETGKLILFPSWLEHWVPENKSHHDRVVLSFNATWQTFV